MSLTRAASTTGKALSVQVVYRGLSSVKTIGLVSADWVSDRFVGQ